MDIALYDPDGGYYMGREDIGGHRRDFATIPSLSPLLGAAVANWAKALPGRGPLEIIEIGAGGGHLAQAVIREVGWWARRRLRYHIVEISPQLRQTQGRLLAGQSVIWHDDMAGALMATKRPAIISNELVDAFPCRQLRWNGASWEELRLPWPPPAGLEGLQAHPYPGDDMADLAAMEPANWPDSSIPTGQVIETHGSYRIWLESWLPGVGGLDHLTIDYGGDTADLYRGRLAGTLRGYFAHLRRTGMEVFQGPGRCDLTADVNFTDLDTWGRECGLRTMEMTDQAGFLERWLPRKRASGAEEDLARIADPEGAGGAFKVLWQTRD